MFSYEALFPREMALKIDRVRKHLIKIQLKGFRCILHLISGILKTLLCYLIYLETVSMSCFLYHFYSSLTFIKLNF